MNDIKRTLDAEFDEVVIGANLNALSYAYNRNIPIIFTRMQPPYIYQLETKKEDYDRFIDLMFILASKSLVLFSDLIYTLRIEDANTLKAFTLSNIAITIKVNKLTIADDYKLEGLDPPTGKTSDEVLLIDHFQIYPTSNRGYEQIKSTNTTFNVVHFYKFFSQKTNYYRCLTVSKANESQIDQFEFSQTAIRIELTKFLESHGFVYAPYSHKPDVLKPIYVSGTERQVIHLGHPIYETAPSNHKFIWEEEKTIYPKITPESLYGFVRNK